MIIQKDKVIDELFEAFPDSSRVWVYQANRAFNEHESDTVKNKLLNFSNQWESHGQPVESKAELIFDRFIVFVINDAPNKAGGCSIDTSVHLMKQFEKEFNIELFNRLQVVAYSTDGELIHFDFKETPRLLENEMLTANSTVFNNTISNLAGLKSEWMTDLQNSWLKRYL